MMLFRVFTEFLLPLNLQELEYLLVARLQPQTRVVRHKDNVDAPFNSQLTELLFGKTVVSGCIANDEYLVLDSLDEPGNILR